MSKGNGQGQAGMDKKSSTITKRNLLALAGRVDEDHRADPGRRPHGDEDPTVDLADKRRTPIRKSSSLG